MFVAEGVIHYCVPNVPARVARTATHAWSNAVLPYLQLIGEHGIDEALRRSPELASAVVVRP